MRIDLEVGFSLGILLIMQLLTAFAAIALFNRMSPAVEEILQENVISHQAASDMLAILAGPVPDQRADAFALALEVAREHVTDPREQLMVDIIESRGAAALAGDLRANIEVVDALRHLTVINRELMQQANRVALQRGRAGAWTAVVLGISTFVIGATIYRRMRTRIERPMLEIDRTLLAVRAGEAIRRCAPLGGPREMQRVAQNVNWMLDRWMLQREHGSEDRLRSSLLHLLDRYSTPMLLVEPTDGILAMNRSALELLDREERPADLLDRLRAGEELAGWSVSTVPNTQVRVLSRSES